MIAKFRKVFELPTVAFEREDDASAARLLHATLLTIAFLSPLVTVTLSLFQGTGVFSLSSAIGVVVSIAMVVLRVPLRRGYLVAVSWLTSFVLLAAITFTLFQFNGVRDSNAVALVIVIVIASLLLRQRLAIALITLASVFALTLVYAGELSGAVKFEPRPLDPTYLLTYVIAFILVGLLLDIAINNLNIALERARASEQGLAKANAELETLNHELEARVTERTRALQLSADISRRLSTILDQDELVQAVVDQLQEAFAYYHVHIYVLDEAEQQLVLVGGTGEVGELMLAQGHSIAVGKGLVGRAAETGLPIVVPDVSKEQRWLPNVLLPATKAEIAVPILRRGRLLGVLDVQEDKADGLTLEDADLLQSVSNQVAVALQNARLFSEAQRRAEQEVLLSHISQEIQSTTDIDTALKVTVRELGRALNRAQTGVRLKIPAVNENGGKGSVDDDTSDKA